jgi:hypothetical protein
MNIAEGLKSMKLSLETSLASLAGYAKMIESI